MPAARPNSEHRSHQRFSDAALSGHDRHDVRDPRAAAETAGRPSRGLPVLIVDWGHAPRPACRFQRREDRLDSQPVRTRALLDRFVFTDAATGAAQSESAHDRGGNWKLRDELLDVRLWGNLNLDGGHGFG